MSKVSVCTMRSTCRLRYRRLLERREEAIKLVGAERFRMWLPISRRVVSSGRRSRSSRRRRATRSSAGTIATAATVP